MKRALLLVCICSVLSANAQNYFVSFAGTGASTSVNSVKVENLTSGEILNLNGSDILRLTVITGTASVKDYRSSSLMIYPNPMTDNSTLEIYPPLAGDATIYISDLNGKAVAHMKCYLDVPGSNFRLSGIKSGLYNVIVSGNNYQLSAKLVSCGKSSGTINIKEISSIKTKAVQKPIIKESRGILTTVDMAYTAGDRLKYTGISGTYSTVKTDIPTGDNSITFSFAGCTDGDNNNYPVVEIGSQVWMAENLKTTRFNDNSIIPLVSDKIIWASLITPGYCWYNNDAANNKSTFGGLYNWYVIDTLTTSYKNVCPLGWHVPSDNEWTVLTTFLGGESFAGSKMKETGINHWLNPNSGATNESGFTALPGGGRKYTGAYLKIDTSGLWWSSVTPGYPVFRSINSANDNLSRDYAYREYGFSIRCLQDKLAELTTTKVSALKSTTVNSGGSITNDGGSRITARGVCWSISHNPTIEDSKTDDGIWKGSFTSSVSGLIDGTTYYVRAYATNGAGTAYGNELTFFTPPIVTDVEGNIYTTVIIGTQTWMAENLKTTKYNDNTSIPLVTDNTIWASLITPGYCWYNNDAANYKASYGALYNCYTLDPTGNIGKNVCPVGWHIPTYDEWTTMITFIDSYGYDGGYLKETGTIHWQAPNEGATNSTGFTALPGGSRYIDGNFKDIGILGCFWSPNDQSGASDRYFFMGYSYSYAGWLWDSKKNGFSVRCIKD
jgi:uncharacterized protein (TIGR02145 family)